MSTKMALLSLCDAVLACAAVGKDTKTEWQALRNKASGQYDFANIFGDMFGRKV